MDGSIGVHLGQSQASTVTLTSGPGRGGLGGGLDRLTIRTPLLPESQSLLVANLGCFHSKLPSPHTLSTSTSRPINSRAPPPTCTPYFPAAPEVPQGLDLESVSASGRASLRWPCRTPPPWPWEQHRLTDLLTLSRVGASVDQLAG